MKNTLILVLMFCSPAISLAETAESSHAEQSSAAGWPSVKDRLREMDKDRNGMVTASEVRGYLQAKHGKGYEKNILDKMQSSENGLSCGTPFAQSFY